jgi:hypothetical protein
MEETDRIIVIESFYNAVQAGIAKSLLDAQDIPCFLTEENMGMLYPFRSDGFSGVRLHIFSADEVRAREILNTLKPE